MGGKSHANGGKNYLPLWNGGLANKTIKDSSIFYNNFATAIMMNNKINH